MRAYQDRHLLGRGIGVGREEPRAAALEHGATSAEIEQAILLGVNTRGFPATVAAWQWAWEQIERDRGEKAAKG